MTGYECIRIAFAGLRETGHSTELSQMIKIRLPSGEHFMNIGLMSHIEYEAVFLRIVDRFQRYG